MEAMRCLSLATVALFLVAGCVKTEVQNSGDVSQEEEDPAEVVIGERLFLETRFAQFFFANNQGDVNLALGIGDPTLDKTQTTGNSHPGPFRGQSINCRACHFVDEHTETLGNRTYADYTDRSPVPVRGDGKIKTARNSPPLVNAFINRPTPFLLHLDGEFPDVPSLVKGTLTGRNLGWLPGEQETAVQHIAKVIREDNGLNELGKEFGGPYRRILLGKDASIPANIRLPKRFRLDVATASDSEILNLIAELMTAYMVQLEFVTDDSGEYDGSPYDSFLKKNGLPRSPMDSETNAAYAERLLKLVIEGSDFDFITPSDGKFKTHNQKFEFGEQELAGLKIFFSRKSTQGEVPTAGVGNCVACHAPPAFTDFVFHNTGVAQEGYDAIFGEGTFVRIKIPDLEERLANHNAYLPATSVHKNASGKFMSPPSVEHPGEVDLGMWNVFLNPDFVASQPALKMILGSIHNGLSSRDLLEKTVAQFKTPSLRDLGHSEPYLHTGRMQTLEDVVEFYMTFSKLGRRGKVRNSDPEAEGIHLAAKDIVPLVNFLRSLNEDYE